MTTTLTSLTPFAPIFFKPLGLEDKNGNGTIDKGAGEGYEEFFKKYGDADLGYRSDNGALTQKANNQLDEKEIEDYYYKSIRFVNTQVTTEIEAGFKDFVFTHKLAPVCMLNANAEVVADVFLEATGVSRSTLETFSAQTLTETLRKVPTQLGVTIRPINGIINYDTLPQAIQNKAWTCFESTMFAFWFMSELHVRTMPISVNFEFKGEASGHLFLMVPEIKQNIDLTKFTEYYPETLKVKAQTALNPIEAIGLYYYQLSLQPEIAGTPRQIECLEQALQYQKNNSDAITSLVFLYAFPPKGVTENFARAASLGQEFIDHFDFEAFAAGQLSPQKHVMVNLKAVFLILIKSYSRLNKQTELTRIGELTKKYFKEDPQVKDYLARYIR